MPHPSILSTKKLQPSQESLLLQAGVGLVSYSAIKIQPKLAPNLPQNIENAIITSQNTFRAIRNKTTIENAFVVGEKTASLLKKNNIKVETYTNYAADLVQEIKEKYAHKHFVFPCSSKRRETIPSGLNKNKITFTEVEAYKTSLNPKKFKQVFEGILFFSPSGVESFYQENSPKPETVLFCIGTTTASAAKKYSDNLIIAGKPTIESVIVSVVKHFFPERWKEKEL
ncbi:uroporphyrinogen-III synthase [Haloflavibacter putidus]|uniref:Uroporphyrinogen-III synthase n=1 Tax=Haloflavibacter putidus TaxID=2576776 RepID=A0A507ZT94_9FLAO|nr:uroporphyrinogen-III synthase [Haloflavibacter putidus]TQD40619.1 uroporphyrinogen-III synthase [Haloflavibacter putidus]